MKKIVFFSIPLFGHVNYGLKIAKRLSENGYDVIYYSGIAYKRFIENSGVRFHSYSAEIEYQFSFKDSTYNNEYMQNVRAENLDHVVEWYKFCHHLYAIGLPILVFAEEPLQIACSVIGVMKSRNIVVPLSVKTPLSRILEIIDTCGIKGYISLDKQLELNLPHIPTVYERESNYQYAGVPSDDAYIIYTSGTTGNSKGVLVGHKGLVNSIVERNSILGINRNSNCCMQIELPNLRR